jgi:hypothetical protein
VPLILAAANSVSDHAFIKPANHIFLANLVFLATL